MLHEYKRKRDFKVTPEPSGSTSADDSDDPKVRGTALTFVIQKHAARRLHYDFRLEVDGVMVSWAVPKGPSLNPADKRLAVMTEDHPMEYSSFEGVIPEKQYGAGHVIIWDQGIYSPDEGKVYSWDDKADANKRMRDGLKSGKLSFYLKGEKLEGSWTLVRLHGKEKEWLLIKHHDQFESTEHDVTADDASVVSGRTLESLQKGETKPTKPRPAATPSRAAVPTPTSIPTINGAQGRKAAFPKKISPMLASLADEPFKSDGWFFEPKLDGIRAIAFIKGGKCRLSSRRGTDLTMNYPVVTGALTGYDDDIVFDGEVVALDQDGRPSFQKLQQSSGGLRSFGGTSAGAAPGVIVYYVFDILYAHGCDLSNLSVLKRKAILKRVLKESPTVRLVQSLGNDGVAAFQACVGLGLEGIVGKREDSSYEFSRRSKSWLKVKQNTSGEFLVCGYTEGTGSRLKTFGSLILAEHDSHGNLVYVGGVGTGLDGKKLDFLLEKMRPLVTKQCPLQKRPPGKLNPTWVKPELVVEVKFMERTDERILRAPVYLGLREDIDPDSVHEPEVVHVAKEPKVVRVAKKKAVRAGIEPESVRAGIEPAVVHVSTEPNVVNSTKQKSEGAMDEFSEQANLVLEQLSADKEKMDLHVDGSVIPLTNLNKIYWPEHGSEPAITKRDYIRYLAKVSSYVIPHLTDRLITLTRFPNGINEGRFYQKHFEKGLPKFVKTARVFTEHENKDQDFLLCNNLPTLLWLGQIADLELHTSHTRVDREPDAMDLPTTITGSVDDLEASYMNYPDYVVLDLDPYLYSGLEKKGAEPELHRQGFKDCVRVAFWLKQVLDSLKLESFIKTSGKTGLHIYIPIMRTIDYSTVRALSEIICRQVLKEHPDAVTMDWAIVKRTGKVFMDHNMNARSKSLASIYSPRVAPEACVSTPLDWGELDSVYPTDFTMRTLPTRLIQKGDLWKDILQHKHNLKSMLSRDSESRIAADVPTIEKRSADSRAQRKRRTDSKKKGS